MTGGQHPGRRGCRVSRSALATLAVLAPASSLAATLDSFVVDATARLGVSSDPFLSDRPDSAAGFVELNLAPSYRIDDELGSTEFYGSVGRTQYLNDYGSTHYYGAGASSNRRLGERTDFRAQVDFRSEVLSGPRSVFGLFPGGSDPVTGPVGGQPDTGASGPPAIDIVDDLEPLDPDLGLAGERQRRVDVRASAGLAYRPTAEDVLDFEFRASRARYPGRPRQSNYRGVGGTFGYSRSISPTLSAGLSGSYDRYDYDGGGAQTEVFTPQATIRGRLSETWTFDAALGASIVRSEGAGDNFSSTGLSGRVGVCGLEVRLNTCLSISRGVTPTGLGNVTTQTAVDLVATYQLSERETLRSSASYSRVNGTLGLSRQGYEFVRAGQSYERRLSERMVGGVNVEARLLYGEDRPTAGDLTGQVFLTYRFGNRT